MSQFTVVGGFYVEYCVQPLWEAMFGSAGRALHAVSSLVESPARLVTYVRDDTRAAAQNHAAMVGAELEAQASSSLIRFQYFHPLSTPRISPAPSAIAQEPPLQVKGEVVLRYGMLEGSAVVDADTAVYDPQSAFEIERFGANGSKAKRLALVLNRGEVRAMCGIADPLEAGRALLKSEGAEVVVIKMGPKGAMVVTATTADRVPLYRTERVWKLGSGDLFSSTFAALWGCRGMPAAEAADYASRATAHYCETRSLPIPPLEELKATVNTPLEPGQGQVYLAGPFFDIGQRWLVEEALSHLSAMGAQVFSPVHAVGPGPAHLVAPADIKGLEESQVVFANLNGLDAGTVFEVGYAVKKGVPVVALAQNLRDEDLKMVQGMGCEVVDDYASAIYRTIWRLPPG